MSGDCESDEIALRAKLGLRAIRIGVRQAALEHQREGRPMVIWRDGRVQWVPAEEVLADIDKADAADRDSDPSAPQ